MVITLASIEGLTELLDAWVAEAAGHTPGGWGAIHFELPDGRARQAELP